MTGKFAVSKAGHDKDRFYVIVAQKDGYVYLCDGKTRLLAKPKKKKEKHIQIVNHTVSRELLDRLLSGEKVQDEEIKYELKKFGKRQAGEA